MYTSFVVEYIILRGEEFPANFTRNLSLPAILLFESCLAAVGVALVSVHMHRVEIRSVAKLALVLLSQFISGRVVSLVVGVQLFYRIVVTLADLTDDVTRHGRL